jgi:hypothetical protein
MTDVVATQVLHDGPRNYIVRLSSVSDGTGESAVVKVDPSTLFGAPVGLALDKIKYTTAGMAVQMHWEADAPDLLWSFPSDDTNELDFCRIGGLQNPKSTGQTGKVTLTTSGHTSGDTYNIVLQFRKKYGQPPLAITSAASVEVEENANLAHGLTANRSATWSIVGGADADQFEVDGSTLMWASDGTQDYESPADANTDNVYAVTVRATDAFGATDDLIMAVTVTDAEE